MRGWPPVIQADSSEFRTTMTGAMSGPGLTHPVAIWFGVWRLRMVSGAPRIHGELLKLGITISERTVSRYLRPCDDPVTNLANVLRESLRWPDIYVTGDVRGCGR